MKEWIWNGKPWQAFKDVAILFSFVMNVVLLVLLIIGAMFILPAFKQVAAPIVGGLNDTFVDMGDAHIRETVAINHEMEITFDVPIETQTMATLAEPVPMSVPTTFVLPAGGGSLNGTVNFQLPQGIQLPVQLNLVVPVSKTVPIDLSVDVDIPLEETDLGRPFADLYDLFAPLDEFLSDLPGDNGEMYRRLLDSVRLAEDVSVPEQLGYRQ